jgi:hypothetical protein
VERSLSGQKLMAPFTSDGHYRFHHPRGLHSPILSDHSYSQQMDPFRAHLVALLSIYELGPFPGTPIPRYEGPTDWQTESILKSFAAIARRMCSAEETVIDLRKQLVIVYYLHTKKYYLQIHSRTVKQFLRNRLLNKVLEGSLLSKKKIHRFHGSMGRT